jgi:hypothetical protein
MGSTYYPARALLKGRTLNYFDPSDQMESKKLDKIMVGVVLVMFF